MKKLLTTMIAIVCTVVMLAAAPSAHSTGSAQAGSGESKPNILVIMSDDVGVTNISAYSRGLVGYQTPNIDRIAPSKSTYPPKEKQKNWIPTVAGKAWFPYFRLNSPKKAFLDRTWVLPDIVKAK